MADVNVTINDDGTYDPRNFGVFRGDSVTFHYVKAKDVVLCISSGDVFGADRFEIPNDQKRLQLVVQDWAPFGPFACTAFFGDDPPPVCPPPPEKVVNGGDVRRPN